MNFHASNTSRKRVQAEKNRALNLIEREWIEMSLLSNLQSLCLRLVITTQQSICFPLYFSDRFRLCSSSSLVRFQSNIFKNKKCFFLFVRFLRKLYATMTGNLNTSRDFVSIFNQYSTSDFACHFDFTFCYFYSLKALVHSSRKLTLRLLDFISKHQVGAQFFVPIFTVNVVKE